MQLEERIQVFSYLGRYLESFISKIDDDRFINLNQAMFLAEQRNPWFSKENQLFTLKNWAEILTEEKLFDWLKGYPKEGNNKNIGIICAGNIPMVGFHDILAVIMSGNHAKIKLSSKDDVLIPFFFSLLKNHFTSFKNCFEFVDKIKDIDAVIATGSNNTARYFESYFKNMPVIIRKNRTSIAVITGMESETDLNNLAEDVLRYFGLGCRNVTQLFVPKNYDLNKIFKAFYNWKEIINHHKYANNYDYNKAIFLMNQTKITENGFLLLKEGDELNSPLATLYYKEYENLSEVEDFIENHIEEIQCVVGNEKNSIPFGKAQKPSLVDYADGINTLDWLFGL